ncbi:hypothetical protein BH24ACT3_BH24ACT3_03640 [soil metagenome]
MSFEELRGTLGAVLDRDLSATPADARLDEELDSVELFEALIALEDLAGVALEDDVLADLVTLGDLHRAVADAARA